MLGPSPALSTHTQWPPFIPSPGSPPVHPESPYSPPSLLAGRAQAPTTFIFQHNLNIEDGEDLKHDFERLQQAMEMVGFLPATKKQIFSVLSAILYLGNVTYKKRATGRDEGLEVGPPEVLDTLSKLLKVPPVSTILSCPCFLAAQWGSLPSPRQWQPLSTGDKWGTSVCCLLPRVISEMSPSCCCLCLSVYVCLATYTV